ncbi:hypothetical protein AWE78_15235 [Escherichia coli]|nr:hypothetical protein AWE78_15235 [Escherichia coli]
MAQVINTNSLSLLTQNNLNKSQSALGSAIERLSSGLRINSAKDDAAGQAIANRFTSNIKVKWSTKTGHRVRVFSSIDFPIRLVVTHHYIRAVLVRCNIQRYSPLLRELHR